MARLNLEEVKQPVFLTSLEIHIGYINMGAHLGHDSLVSLLQEVRERFFRSFGESESDCEGLGIMVVNLAVEYLNEGTYGDELSVNLGVGKVGGSSFEFTYQVYNQQRVELARALTTHVFCDKHSRKSAPIPEKILNVFKKGMQG